MASPLDRIAMDPTALPPSLTAMPTTQAAGTAKPPDADAEDFAALLLRAGQGPAEAAPPAGAPGPRPVAAPEMPAPASADVMRAIGIVASAPPVPEPGLPVAEDASAPAPVPPEARQAEARGDSEADNAGPAEVTPQPAVLDPSAMLPTPLAQAMPTIPPPPTPVPVAADSLAGTSTPRLSTAAPPTSADGLATVAAEALPPEAAPTPAAGASESGSPGPGRADPAGLLQAFAGTTPARAALAKPEAPPVPAGTPSPAEPAPPPTPVPPAMPESPPAPQPGPVARPRPSAAGDRPIEVAAAIGQATATEQAASASETPPAPKPERVAGMPAPASPAAHHPAEPAQAQPIPPDPVQALPSGLSPPPPIMPGADSAGAVSAAPANAAPAMPPARQVAQVTIALAMGQGQAPRITVALEPESLGRVEICIERGTESEAASVQILAERPETLALLQRDARELDRTLAQAGVSVASGGPQFGLSGGSGGQPQEQRPQQQGGRAGGRGGAGGGGASQGPDGPAQVTLRALSLLDIAV